MTLKLWTVDAFTDKPFTGNPAAVILVDNFPETVVCQKIAAEINLPITTFVKNISSNHFHLRWFSPHVEIDLCGHGTLAAAHILFQEDQIKGENITFDSLSPSALVKRTGNHFILDFPLFKIGDPFPFESLTSVLEQTKLVNVTKAYGAILAELRNEEDVRNLEINPEILKKIECEGLIVTAKGKAPYDFVSRVFGPRKGINEDPVTGSAHCLLADYWQQKLGKLEFLAYQASPRGGSMGVQIIGDRVHLKGQAVTILQGDLKIPL